MFWDVLREYRVVRSSRPEITSCRLLYSSEEKTGRKLRRFAHSASPPRTPRRTHVRTAGLCQILRLQKVFPPNYTYGLYPRKRAEKKTYWIPCSAGVERERERESSRQAYRSVSDINNQSFQGRKRRTNNLNIAAL